MTNQPPARRRRIAGERRRPLVDETDSPTGHAGNDAEQVVSLAKSPDSRTSGGATVAPLPPSTTAVDDSGTDTSVQRRRRRPRLGPVPRPGPLDLVFGVLILAGVGLIAVLLLGLPQGPVRALGLPEPPDLGDVRQAEQAQAASESAPSIAERAAAAILAYDYRTLDADRDAAQRFMTSSFAEQYTATFDKTVAPPARTYRAQVRAEVKGSSVVRATSDRVRVLLFIDQTTRSTANPRPQVALNRVEFDMVRTDGEWLVDDISSY